MPIYVPSVHHPTKVIQAGVGCRGAYWKEKKRKEKEKEKEGKAEHVEAFAIANCD